MLTKVIIIGARADGHAKVVLKIIQALPNFKFIGFVDDNIAMKGNKIDGYPVLGQIKDIPQLITQFNIQGGITAIGNNAQRRKLNSKIEEFGLELINAIHPSVIMDNDVEIGKGNYIGQGVVLVTGTKIGNSVNIHVAATIDHDNILEDGVNIGPGVHTAGRVSLGKDSFLGTGSCVIPDIKIGQSVIAGAGTVIIRDVPAFTKIVGNPAKEIGKINQEKE